MTSRDVARRVLARVEMDGAWATLALDGELERSGLDLRDRRLAAELVYGVIRHRLRLDRALSGYADLHRTPPMVVLALRLAAYQVLFLDRVPAHAAIDDAVGAVRQKFGPKLGGFANAVLRRLSDRGEPPLPDQPRARLEVEHSMPGWILDELTAARGADQLATAIAALAGSAPLAIRVNTARTSRDDLAETLRGEGARVELAPDAPAGLWVEGLGSPVDSASFRAGLWTVQDLAAQRVAHLVAPAPGARILDACAGVGGKATHLVELTAGKVSIDAADLSATKLDRLVETARRLGHDGIKAIRCDLLDPTAPLAASYDVVILDAPCTGLGVLRRHPEAKWRLGPVDIERMADLQRRLLDAMAGRVAAGGVLVYSVCTFTAAEGPRQIEAFLARHPEFSREAPPASQGIDWSRALVDDRTWPDRDRADAFFMVRLRRR